MNNCVHDWGCWKREPLKSAKIIGLQFAPRTISSRNCIKGNRSGIYRDAARHRSFPVTECASRALQIAFDRISPTTLTLPPRAPGYSPTPRRSNGWKKKKNWRDWHWCYIPSDVSIRANWKTRRNFREKQFCETAKCREVARNEMRRAWMILFTRQLHKLWNSY